MLKGLRWPLLALILASGLLILAVLTRPEDTPNTKLAAAATETATPTPPPASSHAAEATPVPEVQALPPDEPPVPPENILVEALVGEIRKLNPLLATHNPVDRDITSLIFEGLTDTNEYGEIIPDLAESWTVSTDGLEYIFLLRDDVLWQDGLPFTAEDVTLTVNIISDPLFPGAASLYEFWQTVEVDALDTHMVRFRLTQPLASFPDQLRIGIIPAHVFAGAPVDQLGQHPFNLSPIGTGPYQIETLTASEGHIDGIQLRVAPVYRQRPEGTDGYGLDRIVFRTYPTAGAALDAYRQGEVNSISTIPYDLQAAAAQTPGLSLYTAVEPHVGVLIYNWQNDAMRPVRNPRARLALAHAVDRAALVTTHLLGRAIPADSPLLPGSWAYEPGLSWPVYDLAQAQALLETANVSDEAPPAEETPPEEGEPAAEGDEPPAEMGTESTPEASEESPTEETESAPPETPSDLIILTPDDPALIALANDIASGWEQLGFMMAIEPVDAGTLHARLEAGEFDAALIELSFEPSADPDPYVFWHQGQYGSGQNYGGMDDRRISEALEMARRDPTGMNRVIHYHQFQQLFSERVPALVLYYPLYIYAADVQVEGIQLGFLSSPSDRFRNVQEWTFADTTGG
jgi:peptide/nickel transport system substrate-binding protein